MTRAPLPRLKMPRDAPALAEVYDFMTLGQRLLAALLALAMMSSLSAGLWLDWQRAVQ